MTTVPAEQRNPYKGAPPRPWVRLRFIGPDDAPQELELLADTCNPWAILISQEVMDRLRREDALAIPSNYGILDGGWFRLAMPDLGLEFDVVAYASDAVAASVKASGPDFDGLVGLPFLRKVEYGGDANCFWIRTAGPGT